MGEAHGDDEANRRRHNEAAAAKDNALRIILSSEARQRLTAVRMVKPELAKSIEDRLFQLASSGQLKQAITDEDLKRVLESYTGEKKDFKIRWI